MNKLAAMRTFRRVVERGGFARAAADLGLSNAAASKHVRELEAELGAPLLARTTRRISLTEAGQAYFERCCRILDEIEAAELEAGAAQAEPRGRLRVTAPMTLGLLHLAPLLAEFSARHPQVQVDLSLNDRFVDLVEEGYDVGLRARRALEDSSLVARRVCRIRRVLVAAPAYLEAAGEPRTPEALARHRHLVYSLAERQDAWELWREGRRVVVPLQPLIRANSGLALRAPLLAGAGVALTPTFIVGEALAQGRLQRLLTDYEAAAYDLYALYPASRWVAPKVRAFVDFVVERLSDPPPWDRAAGTGHAAPCGA